MSAMNGFLQSSKGTEGVGGVCAMGIWWMNRPNFNPKNRDGRPLC